MAETSEYQTPEVEPHYETIAEWVSEAQSLIDNSEYARAIWVLENEHMLAKSRKVDAEQEGDDVAANMVVRRDWQAAYVSAVLLRIQVRELVRRPFDPFDAIFADYDLILDIATRWGIDRGFALDYANLLERKGDFARGVEVARMAATDAESASDEERLATSLTALARNLAGNHQEAEAEAELLRAREIFGRLATEDGKGYERKLAETLAEIAYCAEGQGRHFEAEDAYRWCIEHYETYCKLHYGAKPDTSYMALTLENMSHHAMERNRSEEGARLLRRAIEIREKLRSREEEPSTSKSLDLANTLILLGGIVLLQEKRDAEAEPLFRRAVEVLEPLVETDGEVVESNIVLALNGLAPSLSGQGRMDEAEAIHDRAREIAERLMESDPFVFGERLALTLTTKAVFLEDLGRHLEAETLWRRALDVNEHLAERDADAYDSNLAETLRDLARCLIRQGREDEAFLYLYQALSLIEGDSPDDDMQGDVPEIASTLEDVATCAEALGHADEAERLYLRSVTCYDHLVRFSTDFDGYLAATLKELADCIFSQGRVSDAEAYYRRSVGAYEALFERDATAYAADYANALTSLAECLRVKGDEVESMPYLDAIFLLGWAKDKVSIATSDYKRRREATRLYHRAIQVLKPLARKDPDTYDPLYRETLDRSQQGA